MCRKFLVILLGMLAFPCLSIQYHFDKFDVEDGLNHDVIRGIVQDSKGFLWVATEGGLNRYDGFEFKEYLFKDELGQTSNVISDIVIDKNNVIWLATFGSGILRFDPTEGSFLDFDNTTLTSKTISKLFVDSRNNVWVGTVEEGLDLIVQKSTSIFEFSSFDVSNSLSNPSISAFTEDKLGRVWVGTDGGGINIYQPETKSWNVIKHSPNNSNSLPDNRIRSLFRDNSGAIWIGTASNGLSKFEPETQEFNNFTAIEDDDNTLSDNRILVILQDKKNNLWIGTDNGISVFNGTKFERIRNNRNDPSSLSNNRVLSIYQDNRGLIWAGTYSGLNKWNPETAEFNHTIPSPANEFDYSLVLSFAEDSKNHLYTATYGGGIAVRSSGGNWKSINSENSPISNRTVSVFVDRSDGIWIGTRASGLFYREKEDSEWLQYKHIEGVDTTLPSNGITNILEDNQGNIWISTYNGGLSKKISKGFKNFTKYSPSDEALSSLNIMQIMQDSDGYIWLATDNGINLIDPNSWTVTQFLPDNSVNGSLASEITWFIMEDSRGNFWIATHGFGLYFWSFSNRVNRVPEFKSFTQEDGLNSNIIYGVTQDKDGFIWFSSSKGLGRISEDHSSIESFDTSHGLQGYDFNLGAVFKDSKGNIYFGGSNGFNSFDPVNLNKSPSPPKTELLSITIIDKPVAKASQDKLLLHHNDYLVSFDYVALDFAAPEKNQYKYRLTGFDNDWIDVGNRRRATYTNLPAGNYQFQVKAANNDGVWSGPQINLPVVVKPAPWKTPLAYAIYVIIIGTAIIWFLRNQMQRLAFEEKQRKELEQQVAKRTQELAEQNKQLQKLNTDLALAYRTDALTGIKNRRFLESYLQDSLPSLVPFDTDNPKYMLVLLLDIDNLKPINDAYGHAAGDATISHAATLLSELIPENYNLIRWGGDEFLLLGITSNKEESTSLVNRLIGNVNAEQFLYLDKPIALSCSAGFAHYPFDEEHSKLISWDQVTMLADKAMNCAKSDSECTWIGVKQAKRKVNDLYVSDLMHCAKITEATELVELCKG